MKITLIGNTGLSIYIYRFELCERLLKEGHEVYVICPNDNYVTEMVEKGCKHYEVAVDRHGTNPIKDLKLLKEYKRALKEIKPDIVFTYTIKPNIYGAMACKKLKIPCSINVTGLGTAVEKGGILQIVTTMLYKIALKKVKTVFFQNQDNMQFFIDKKIALGKHYLLPGSGVNLEKFALMDLPSEDNIGFVFISRIMKEKGIDNYLDSAKCIKEKYPNTIFHVCGFCEEDYEQKLKEYHDNGIIVYHGMVRDIRTVLKDVHCTVHPSYYPEGLANVLLESGATGRAIITTDRAGCREVLVDGVNGYLVKQDDTEDLIKQIEKYLALSYQEKVQMGLNGREKVEKEFDRQIVIERYLKELE